MPNAKLAIIGAGWWGVEVYLPAIQENPGSELVAVNRRDPEALDKILADCNVPAGYTDVDEMLATEDLDAVVITSPHVLHYEHAKAALEAGCHVLIDKPMTTSAEHARDLVALAKAQGKEIVVPYGWNFKDFATTAHDILAAGKVGEIRHVSCLMATHTFDLFGGRGLKESESHMFQPQKSTCADPKRAGGYGWGQLSHALGLMFRLIDLAPKEIYAINTKSAANVDLNDAAVLTFENGATCSISGSALVPKHAMYQMEVRVYGDDGILMIDMERARMELRRHDEDDVMLDLEQDAGFYMAVEPINRLVEVCHNTHATNEATGTVGMRAIEVLDAMYRSFESGKPEAI